MNLEQIVKETVAKFVAEKQGKDLTGDGKIDSKDYLKARSNAIEKAKGLDEDSINDFGDVAGYIIDLVVDEGIITPEEAESDEVINNALEISEKMFGGYGASGQGISTSDYNRAARALVASLGKSLNEEDDHEVSMAQNSLDSIIRSAMELKAKIGDQEINIPAWIQDHITNSENFIDQASQGYHELSAQTDDEAGVEEMDESASDIMFYIVYNRTSDKYEVKQGSKYLTKSQTGTMRFTSEEAADKEATRLNSESLQELNEDNLQVKSIAKDIYSTLKRNGVDAKLIASIPGTGYAGKSIGATLTGKSNEALVFYWDDTKTKLTTIEIYLSRDKEDVLNFEKKILSSFPALEQYSRQEFVSPQAFKLVFRVKEKTTAKGGIQELDEDKMDKEDLKQIQLNMAQDHLENLKNSKYYGTKANEESIKKAEERIEKLEDELDALAEKSVNEAFDEFTVRRWQHYAGIK